MEDNDIIDLFFNRDEKAIVETQNKYNNYLFKISSNILSDNRDREESVNDTYIKAWNSIPPIRPRSFRLYLAKIVRNISIDLYRKYNSDKRGNNQYQSSLDEIGDIIGKSSVEEEIDLNELTLNIEKFLNTLNDKDKNVFLMRYFYIDSIKEISNYMDMSESSVKQSLFKSRNKLKLFLVNEGYIL